MQPVWASRLRVMAKSKQKTTGTRTLHPHRSGNCNSHRTPLLRTRFRCPYAHQMHGKAKSPLVIYNLGLIEPAGSHLWKDFMPTDVLMPQMGESIFEGTITKWLKKPGEKVQRDEPLFEISTDKVDAEIPAPAAGVLKEIKVNEGATVQVNTVVGVIDAEGAAAAAKAPAEQPPAQTKASPQADGAPTPQQPPVTEKSAPLQEEKAAGGGNGGAGTDVVMPQMGESIFEGTITKWLKKVGDKVQRDEPLFEISTDKVDAEIPAPASGVLREIKVKEGATVQVNSVVAVIGGSGAQAPAAAPQKPAAPAKPAQAPAAPPPQQHEVIGFPAQERAGFSAGNGGQAAENVRSSPLVRRIARENNVDLSRVPGTGLGGRISKQDIQNFIQQHGAGQAPAAAPQAAARPVQMPQQAAAQPTPRPPAPAPAVQLVPGELVPMTPMRKTIA